MPGGEEMAQEWLGLKIAGISGEESEAGRMWKGTRSAWKVGESGRRQRVLQQDPLCSQVSPNRLFHSDLKF